MCQPFLLHQNQESKAFAFFDKSNPPESPHCTDLPLEILQSTECGMVHCQDLTRCNEESM